MAITRKTALLEAPHTCGLIHIRAPTIFRVFDSDNFLRKMGKVQTREGHVSCTHAHAPVYENENLLTHEI